MKWVEFKARVESRGVRDEDLIEFIQLDCDHGVSALAVEREVRNGEAGGWAIYDTAPPSVAGGRMAGN